MGRSDLPPDRTAGVRAPVESSRTYRQGPCDSALTSIDWGTVGASRGLVRPLADRPVPSWAISRPAPSAGSGNQDGGAVDPVVAQVAQRGVGPSIG